MDTPSIQDWIDVAFANRLGMWCLGLALLSAIGALLSWGMAYRFLGRRIQPDAAVEWLLRWQEMNPFERWTLLQAYVRMNEEWRKAFRQAYSQLGCRVFKEFSAMERFILELRGDTWLRSEILQSWSDPPEPRLIRPMFLPRPMDHPHRPCTVPQILARSATRRLFGLAGALVVIGGIFLYL